MALNYNDDFPAQTLVDAAYPQGKAKNVGVPGDGTGTPWIASIVNDYWGLLQRLLARFGITPSAVADTGLVSQYFDAIDSLASGRAAEVAFSTLREVTIGGTGGGTVERTVVFAGSASNGFILISDTAGTPRKCQRSIAGNVWIGSTTDDTQNGPVRMTYDVSGDVVVSCGGAASDMASSADKGDTWSDRTGVFADCDRVLFNGTNFVGWGIGNANNAQHSADGITYSLVTDAGRFTDSEEGDHNSNAGGRILIAQVDQLALSDDDGATWSTQAISLVPARQFNGIAYLRYNAQDVWVAVSDDEGIARSVDNGATWTWVVGEVAGTTAVDYKFVKHHSGGRLMLVGRDTNTSRSFVRTSIDGGLSWGARIDITDDTILDVAVVPGGFVLAADVPLKVLVTGRLPG